MTPRFPLTSPSDCLSVLFVSVQMYCGSDSRFVHDAWAVEFLEWVDSVEEVEYWIEYATHFRLLLGKGAQRCLTRRKPLSCRSASSWRL